MAGISSKAASSMGNKYEYNGYESNPDFDINLNESFYRLHDPQIGRFLQIDPKVETETSNSPFVAMLNNPISLMDPLGDVVINNDKANYDDQKGVYEEAGYKSDKLKREDFKTEEDYNLYKERRDNYKKAEKKYLQTEKLIQDYKDIDPEGFDAANKATYLDAEGKEHNLDIYVSIGEVKNYDHGITEFGFNSLTRAITNDRVYMTVEQSYGKNSKFDAYLAHEIGHTLGMAASPKAYYKSYLSLPDPFNHDCQAADSKLILFSQKALEMESQFQKKAKDYGKKHKK